MDTVLFRHNRDAYAAATAMLEAEGKAAVIHPTGTGKSFIAFQLCADHPDQTVCWLSPSEYIFRAQLENWEKVFRFEGTKAQGQPGGAKTQGQPEGTKAQGKPRGQKICGNADGKKTDCGTGNIRFFTYARLMLMEPEELLQIAPDYIVLDEFHRCGAQAWGQGVQRLLGAFPGARVLGLSATNIRYLDGQRDMADELFDGNIASEMTLGDAIVRGILSPPKYVLCAYSYQKDLERYRARVQGAKGKAVRAEADKYLEALKRALEKADGMDEVFDRHMEDRSGKYLVFCAGYSHMQEMMAEAPEWFRKVDPEPHIYSVYAEDPDAEESFRQFREDASEHLKLLYCIDMLNEGIHVEDVSGVILLRPTVSPTIYKQQIGRALAAGKKEEPVVFDVVMNIENLYSIGTIEEEMQEAVWHYRGSGMGGLVVNERFRIIDEAQDCLRLFCGLEGALSASWDLMYVEAQKYYREHGNLEAPKRYKTADGLSLGQWLDTQRKVRAGKVPGLLTDAQIRRLDALDMRWQPKRGSVWERNFAAAQAYYEEHGNLLVKADEECMGVKLGRWIAQLRDYRRKHAQEIDGMAFGADAARQAADAECAATSAADAGRGAVSLTPERIKALDGIGMVWDVPDYRWEKNYAAAKQYYREHGDLNVPYYYVGNGGVRLGAWLCSMRAVRQERGSGRAGLTERQVQRLDDIGMSWDGRWDSAWERSYEAACRYREEKGDLNVPVAYVSEDGCRLGRWVRHQRDAYKGNMSAERKKKLEAIGAV